MKLANALSDFLYDKNYFITMFEDKVHLYKYNSLKKLSSEEITIEMPDFILNITGHHLFISQMNKDEILITGQILTMGKTYAE